MATRFAGSIQLPDFSASNGSSPSFAPMSFSSTGVSSGAGAAADAVSVGRAFTNIRKNAPNVQGIVQDAATIESETNMAIDNAKANILGAGISAKGTMARAENEADYYKDMASAAQKGGQMSLMGGIAGGAISLLTGGIL